MLSTELALSAAEVAKGRTGNKWVVDIDMTKFFDNVNHDRLMARMKTDNVDKRVLRLINEYLKAGVMESREGTP